MAFIYKSRYTDSDWNSLLKAELDSNRPVFYSGWGSGGHSFVCEGYTYDDIYYMNITIPSPCLKAVSAWRCSTEPEI
jgi:hypothetical protein